MAQQNKNGKGCLILIVLIFLIGFINSLLPKSESEIFEEASSKYRSSAYVEALKLINGAIEIDSTNTEYYELRGKILFELRDTLHSEEDFKRTLKFATSDSIRDRRIKELINWDIQHGDIANAKELLKQEVELYKDNSIKHVEILEYVAEEYLIIGDTLETINLYKKLSEEYKKVGKFDNKVGILYIQMGKNNEALKEFKNAVKIEPENELFLYNLGIAYLNLQNKRSARFYFKKSMELGNREACKEYRELTARTRYYSRTKCCDGTTSSASGRGACSHHGGVCGVEYIPYKEYTMTCN